MPETNLEPEATIDETNAPDHLHGAYPQRVKEFSVGKQDDWGWFEHLATTADRSNEILCFPKWHELLSQVARCPDRGPDDEDTQM